MRVCLGRLAVVALDAEAIGMARGKLGDDRFMRVREWLTCQGCRVARGSCGSCARAAGGSCSGAERL
jgi:hypothetical protein